MNRFKGFELVNKVPEELWIEVHNIAQGAVNKSIPKKKKCKKTKWSSEEALTNSWKRREVRGKGERETHAQLNAEFQSRARRDTKRLLKKTMQRNGGK